jgi:hypothetical protein
MIPPITIRCSSLPQYADCSRRSAARMFQPQLREWGFEVRQTNKNVGAAFGSGAHAGVAGVLLEKMATGTVRVSTEVQDRTEASFREEMQFGIEWDTVTPRPDVALRQLMRTVSTYAAYVAPNVTPTAVEQYLTQQTAAGNTLSGHIDHTVAGVRDLKTGKFEGGNIAQYGAYSLLLRASGAESNCTIEDYIKRVPLDKQQPPPKETSYDVQVAERAAANLIRRIERDYQNFMETGNPGEFLANPNSILCSERLCGAWGTEFCREHKR